MLAPPSRRPLRAIRTLREAMRWGDEWAKAYGDLERAGQRELQALHERLFDLQTDLVIASAEATLWRAQLIDAGGVPLDTSATAQTVCRNEK